MRAKKASIVVLIGCLAVMVMTLAAGCAKDAEEEASEVHLSYANEEYVISGSGEAFAEISDQMILEEGSEYFSVLAALRQPAEEGYLTMLTDNIVMNSAVLSDSEDTVIVDFAQAGLNGGSLQEEILVGQIVRTISLTFEDITYVRFTVEGQTVETLMGHMEADQPFYLQEYVDENGELKHTVQMGEYCYT
jgi:hypothetical protein